MLRHEGFVALRTSAGCTGWARWWYHHVAMLSLRLVRITQVVTGGLGGVSAGLTETEEADAAVRQAASGLRACQAV